jgi:hypothetical protein
MIEQQKQKHDELQALKRKVDEMNKPYEGILELKKQLDNLRNIVMGVKEKESSSQ